MPENSYKPRTFRLDVGDRDEDEVQELIKRWLDHHNDKFEKYAIARETGDITGKIHYQGIIYVDTKAHSVNVMKKFGKWKAHEKSFAPVKNLESYKKYVKKQGDMRYYKGFTDEEISSWGEWEEITKKEKKLSHRRDQYDRFIKYCMEDPSVEMGKYKMDWIAEKLYDFLGKEPLPEQTNWLRGIIFSSQPRLIEECKSIHYNAEKSELTKKRWIERILF